MNKEFLKVANEVLKNRDGPKKYYFEVNQLVAVIREKRSGNPLAVNFSKSEQDFTSGIEVVQKMFEKSGFDVKRTIWKVGENKTGSAESSDVEPFRLHNEFETVLNEPEASKSLKLKIFMMRDGNYAILILHLSPEAYRALYVASTKREAEWIQKQFEGRGFYVEKL